jgi:hypothetical protein
MVFQRTIAATTRFSPLALFLQILAEPIANRAASVKENPSSEIITRFALVQTEMDSTSELRALNPSQREQRPLDPAKFA